MQIKYVIQLFKFSFIEEKKMHKLTVGLMFWNVGLDLELVGLVLLTWACQFKVMKWSGEGQIRVRWGLVWCLAGGQ